MPPVKRRRHKRDEGQDTKKSLQALEIALIARSICKHLQVSDLFNVSTLNKTWNYEARIVLRDHRNAIAANRKGPSPCQALYQLDVDLSRMAIMPFKGLCIHIPDHEEELCHNPPPELPYITNKMKITRLEIKWAESNQTTWDCPAIKLISKMLEKHGHCVEELAFKEIPFDLDPSIFKLSQVDYQELRVVRFPRACTSENVAQAVLNVFINKAPKLRKLDVEFDSFQLRRLLKDKVHLATSLKLLQAGARDLPQSVIEQLMLERLDVSIPARFPVATYSNVLARILTKCSNSLEYLSISLNALAFLQHLQAIPELKNCQKLALKVYPGGYEDEAMIKLIQAVNFTLKFPRIHSVKLVEMNGARGSKCVDLDAILDSVGDSSRINKLELDFNSQSDAFPVLGRIFPHVTELTATLNQQCGIHSDLCTAWPLIKRIFLTQKIVSHGQNSDAVFSGVHPDEISYLNENTSDDFLSEVNIVPTRPTIRCLQELEEFRMEIIFDGDLNYDESEPFLSKVTGYLLLRHLKKGLVTLICSEPHDGFEHLQDFLTVKNNNEDENE